MRAKVFNVSWSRSARVDNAGRVVWGSYQSCVYADLWKPKFASSYRSVDITQDVLNYFGGSKITKERVQQVRDALQNKFIEYYYDEDNGEYFMINDLDEFM